jgi:flagellar P-ring protein precursor FlgI
MKKAVILIFVALFSFNAFAFDVKIGDVANIVGVRHNQLIGYGLVVGLAGTGDGSSEKFTIQSIVNALKKMNVTLSDSIASSLQTKNIAAVIVTADLPPFAKQGDRIDVTVSSIGDAKSLQGGTLIMTPLKAANGGIYAVAQGPLSIGGFNIGSGGGGKVRKNHSTVGRIPNGAIIEREVLVNLNSKNQITYSLKEPSFKLSTEIAKAINRFYRRNIAYPQDSGSVKVMIPDLYRGNVVEFISQVNQLGVSAVSKPRIVLDEKTGTVVIGGDVTIEPISISHGSLTVTIENKKSVSQPNELAKGQTKVVNNKKITVDESSGKFITFTKGAKVSDLVKALNKAGATPRDMMAIFQAIKAAGALNADLEMM